MRKRLSKKILFLASWYPSKEHPLLGNFVQKHAEIANEVAQIDVLYAVASQKVEKVVISDELINHVRTVIVYYPQLKNNLPFIAPILKRKAYLNALKLGFKHLNQHYDLVHLNAVFPAGLFAQWVKKKYKIPFIATVHWTGFLPHNQRYKKLPFYIKTNYQSIFKSAKLVLTVSDHLGKSLTQLNLINDYQVINNVVDEAFFYPITQRKNSTSTARFLHVSSFHEKHKNSIGMLSAFAKLQRDFMLHIITEGNESEVWKAIEKCGVPKNKCIVESKQSAENVGKAMRLADCFVLFSNYETFSVVLAEAWTTGIPAIYSQCGGLTEVNDSVLGVQIQPRDDKALLEALTLFERSSYSPVMISNYAKQFSRESLISCFFKLY